MAAAVAAAAAVPNGKASLLKSLFGTFNEAKLFGNMLRNTSSEDSNDMVVEEEEKVAFTDDDHFEKAFCEDMKKQDAAREKMALKMLNEMKEECVMAGRDIAPVLSHFNDIDAFIADNLIDLNVLVDAELQAQEKKKKAEPKKRDRNDDTTQEDEEELPDQNEAPPSSKKTALNGNCHATFN